MMTQYKVHDVEWTDEKVSRFWDFQNNYEAFENIWFTSQVGSGIVNFVRKIARINGNILDYGTGKGHLIAHLIKLNSVDVYGFDFAPESIQSTAQRFSTSPNFHGTKLIVPGKNFTTYQSEFFDFVFMIEAVEHLTDNYINSTFKEINRVLKRGGKLLVTTPNNEELPHSHVCCPDCGAVFHRVQHMRSFDKISLPNLINNHGFRTLKCGVTNFSYYNELSILSFLKRSIASVRRDYSYPHLYYFGQKQ